MVTIVVFLVVCAGAMMFVCAEESLLEGLESLSNALVNEEANHEPQKKPVAKVERTAEGVPLPVKVPVTVDEREVLRGQFLLNATVQNMKLYKGLLEAFDGELNMDDMELVGTDGNVIADLKGLPSLPDFIKVVLKTAQKPKDVAEEAKFDAADDLLHGEALSKKKIALLTRQDGLGGGAGAGYGYGYGAGPLTFTFTETVLRRRSDKREVPLVAMSSSGAIDTKGLKVADPKFFHIGAPAAGISSTSNLNVFQAFKGPFTDSMSGAGDLDLADTVTGIDALFEFNDGTDFSDVTSDKAFIQSAFPKLPRIIIPPIGSVEGSKPFVTYKVENISKGFFTSQPLTFAFGARSSDLVNGVWTPDAEWVFVGGLSAGPFALKPGTYTVADAVSNESITFQVGPVTP